MKTKKKSVEKTREQNRSRNRQNRSEHLFAQPHMLHDFNVHSVLNGEIEIAALDRFSILCGLIPPSHLYGAVLRQEDLLEHKIQAHESGIQIHYINNHYVTSTQQNGIVTVYDTIPSGSRVSDLMPQLQALYTQLQHQRDPAATVKYILSQFQGCSVDCGVFAAANAQLLLSGVRPDTVHLDQQSLRQHLLQCLLSSTVTAFPTVNTTDMSQSMLERYLTDQVQRNVSQSIPLSQSKSKSKTDTHQRALMSKLRSSKADKDSKSKKKHTKQVREQSKKRKQEQRKSEEFRTTENAKKRKISVQHQSRKHKSEQRKSPNFRAKENEKKHKISVQHQSRKHKSEQRKSPNFRAKENEKKHKISVQHQSRKHKSEQRKSPTFRATENEKKHKPSVRNKSKTHKQEQRKSVEVRTAENARRHCLRLERHHNQCQSFKTNDHSKKDIQLRRLKHIHMAENEQRKKVYATNNMVREKKKKKVLERKQEIRKSMVNVQTVIDNFKKVCKEAPTYTCSVCYRAMFRKQVCELNVTKYQDEKQVQSCIVDTPVHSSDKKYICKNCDQNLKCCKIPSKAMVNSLELEPLPACLQNLNQLERHLISPVIPFMKIMTLPKGLQKGVHGPVVCVPSNITKITKVLPRSVNDDTLVKVKLKRKMEYRGHHLFQRVSVSKMRDALDHLKVANPYFKDIIFNEEVDTLDLDADESSIFQQDTPIRDPPTDSQTTIDGNTHCTSPLSDHSQTDVEGNLESKIDEHSTGCDARNDHIAGVEVNAKSDSDKAESLHIDEDLHETSCPMVSSLQPENICQLLTDDVEDNLYSVAPAEGNKPCSVFNMEMKTFPYLFPDGKNGYNEQRPFKLGLNRYFNLRLFSADLRFAGDPQYIFYSQYASELHYVKSSISIAMRKSSKTTHTNAPVTASMLKDVDERKKIVRSDLGYRFLKTVRGTAVYWEKTLRDLLAMLRQLGTPTWFCSFSAADRRWPEIVVAICEQQKIDVPDNIDWSTHCSIINSNPVTACRMFENRVVNFINSVIMSPAHPIGCVTDFFYRTEFQSRGWPHVHCLFWCETAPKFDSKGNNEEFVNYVDQYVSCEIPEKDSVLSEIVNSVQMHSKNHSKSCRKQSKLCRFNFPRPPSERTFIAQPTPPPENVCLKAYKDYATNILTGVWDIVDKEQLDDISTVKKVFEKAGVTQEAYEKAHSALTKRNTVIYKRNIRECWINPYNRVLLEAWNGNMDIQPVLDPESCIYYIVGYITKSEREQGDLLRRAQQEAEQGNPEPIQLLRKLGNIYLNHREISIMEAVYRVTGMNLKKYTREILYVPTDLNSVRISKPLNLITDEMDDDDLWMANVVDRYLARPKVSQFEVMCLAEFASEYKVSHKDYKCTSRTMEENSDCELDEEESEKVYELQNGLGKVVKRTKFAIVRYPHFNKSKDSERYYANVTRMYCPHRYRDIKGDDFSSFEDMFQANAEVILENMSRYEKLTEDLDEAWQRLQQEGPQEDAWADIAPNQEVQRVEEEEELENIRALENDYYEIDPQDIPDLNEPDKDSQTTFYSNDIPSVTGTSSSALMTEKFRTLNVQQAQLFYYIRDWALKKARDQRIDPFHIFLTGGAGTGKSHLIKCIQNEVQRFLLPQSENPESPVVLLVAPTGTAAYNIGGQTIHSVFNINKSSNQYLGEDSANTLRSKLQDLQLLIIDEISMVSHSLLNTVHCRLQQVKQCELPNVYFGNTSILAVGDFHQVPPVKGKELCTSKQSLTDLWSLFHIWELLEVVRQQGDITFVNMLNRLRVRKKSEILNEDDRKLLQSRLVSVTDSNYPKTVLHIFSTNNQLNDHNSAMLEEVSKGNIVTSVTAADICVDTKSQKSFRRKEPLSTQTSSLPISLKLCPQARVMLTTNIDVQDGLTNGVMGTVTGIIEGTQTLGLPAAVCVVFDNNLIGTKSRQSMRPPPNVDSNSTVIKPHTEVIQHKPHQVTRHQFPLKLAWAVTIHKVQGMTSKQAVVSLRKVFKPGMAYVALSRVTSIDGLYLIKEDFSEDSIYTNPKIQSALAAMPSATSLKLWNQLLPPNLQQLENSILIASHNTEGLLPHLPDFISNYFLPKSDVICLQETWLIQGQTIQNPLQDHCLLSACRHNQYTSLNISQKLNSPGRGGVMMFIRKDIQFQEVDTSQLQIECLAVQLQVPPVLLINVYRPPTLPLQHFCAQLEGLVEEVRLDKVVIVGDFNVDCITSQVPGLHENYDQLIQKSTTRKGSVIDHIYVRNIITLASGVVPCYYSYHEMIYVVLPIS